MNRSLFIILGALYFAIAGKAQGSDVSVQKANTGYSILNDTMKAVKINLTPGLAFRTPTLWLSKRRTAGLMLHCEPGLCITPFYNDRVSFTEIKDAQGVGHPASYTDELYGNITIRTVSNHGGKWLAWRIKSALTFRSGDVFLSLGWLTSDFNIENGRNNIRYTKGKRYNGIEKYKHTNTLFASITGQF